MSQKTGFLGLENGGKCAFFCSFALVCDSQRVQNGEAFFTKVALFFSKATLIPRKASLISEKAALILK